MPLNALLLRQLIKSGVLSVVNKQTLDTLLSYSGRQASNLAKVAGQRRLQQMPIKPGLQYYGAAEATRVGKQATLKALSGITQSQAANNTRLRLLGIRHIATERVADAAGSKYVDLIANSFKYVPDPTGTTVVNGVNYRLTNKVLLNQHKALGIYHSQGGRFLRAGANQFIIDYASFQLINMSMQALEELFPELGPTDKDDPMDWTPYSNALYRNTERAGATTGFASNQGFEDQLLNIAATTLVAGSIGGRLGKLRKNRLGMDNLTYNASTRYGTRLSANTMAARKYYGSRVPEVSGNLLGATAALFALGGDPRQVASTMGVRGIGNAASGFYNYGKPRQGQFPKMSRRKTGKPYSAKRAKSLLTKRKKTISAARYWYDQQKLF